MSPNARCLNSHLSFLDSNSCLFLANSTLQSTKIALYNENACYIGNKNYFNPQGFHNAILGERKNLIIGDECLFSYDIFFRTNDPHLIYESKTNTRINEAKSILIGDHCWIGQDVGLLKGAFVASGCVLGAKSLTSKTCFSNAVYGGDPARCIKKEIFWTSPHTHAFSKAQSKDSFYHKGDEFKFSFEEAKFLPLKLIDEALVNCKSGEERCEFLYDFIYNNSFKNRFALFEDSNTSSCVLYKDDTKESFAKLKESMVLNEADEKADEKMDEKVGAEKATVEKIEAKRATTEKVESKKAEDEKVLAEKTANKGGCEGQDSRLKDSKNSKKKPFKVLKDFLSHKFNPHRA